MSLTAITQEIRAEAAGHSEWIRAIRRELHSHPELGFEEVRTSQKVRDVLTSLDIPFRYPLAQTGIVATIGTGDGPCVGLRADFDGLPIIEQTGLEYSSTIPGRMHACGHDCHTAMLLGAARILKARESEFRGTIRLLFQPAEELGRGARRMIAEGALDDAPPIDRMLGLHIWPQLPTGTIASRSGPLLAGVADLRIEITGVGGHAALPHTTIDPVITSAKIILELQTIVSRELDPLESGVISISTIHAGDAFNVIPEMVRMTGTIRALTAATLRQLTQRVDEMVRAVAGANRCSATVTYANGLQPVTVNDAAVWSQVQSLAGALVGPGHVSEFAPIMGAEDFAEYGAHTRTCFVFLGVGNPELGEVYGVHHPKMRVDEDALPIGASLHALFALDTLRELSSATTAP